MSTDYTTNVKNYWANGYDSENIESHLFRVYGRIFRDDLGINGSNKEKLLDYGCGQGAAMMFLGNKGFDVFGVDTSETNIKVCKNKFTTFSNRFEEIASEVSLEDQWFGGNFKVIISIQTLYYLSPKDLSIRIQSLYNQMLPNSYIYVTMMGSSCWFYDHATKQDSGMHSVNLECKRFKLSDYRVTFMHSESELIDTFKLFKPLHIGYYAAKYRSDEGDDFHYTFIGLKT